MQMLYNSDSYTVVQFDAHVAEGEDAPQRGGLEILDKSARKGIYIDGALADSFRRGVQALVDQGPDPEALDDYIAGYTTLAQQPLVLH
jgi:hypothetical protein